MLAVSATLTLFLAAAPVPEGGGWTLGQLVGEALAKSPEVAAARAEETGAEGELAADSRWVRQNPQLEVEYGTDAVTQDEGERRLSVSISQQLEVAGQRGLRVERAEAALAAAKARRRAVELSVAREAADAAAEVARREALVKLAEDVLAAARALEEATARRFSAGDVSELERNTAALERARAEARAAQARAELASARASVNRLLGRPASAALSVALEAVAVEPPVEPPELVAARAEAEAAQAEVKLLRRERIPDPTVSLGYEREREREEHLTGPDLHSGAMVVARLSLPLPLWNRNQGELAAARARQAVREAEREGREREVAAERVSARESFEAARTAEAALTAALPGIERNLSLVQRAYEAGELGLDALLLARERAFSARGEAIDAAAALARARAALLRASGRLPTGEVPR
ncbi:TolC family protein [Hyalangium gracile]|uniref:TolC family protein n=1 Tax=Hyalangium gracile TaxID=394092 RepID=UPI001CC9B9C8|nr:TolC family protein [Hyalangium gracile]